MNEPASATPTGAASRRSAAGFDLNPPASDQYHALTADLTSDEREVILEHGTEAPFCGVFNQAKAAGTYVCRLCGLPLFRSGTKFDSGTGWPSFFDPIDRALFRAGAFPEALGENPSSQLDGRPVGGRCKSHADDAAVGAGGIDQDDPGRRCNRRRSGIRRCLGQIFGHCTDQ